MNSLQGKFKPFYKYAKSFNSDNFDYDALENGDYIFMRWKVGAKILLIYLFILAGSSLPLFLFFVALRSSF